MPATSDLYTAAGNMMQATVLSASSAASGFPKENLMDWDPDTCWKASGVGTASFVVDLVTPATIQGWALWLKNAQYDLSVISNQQIIVSHSSDNVTYTIWDTVFASNTLHQPIFFGTPGLTSQLKRYWKFEFVTTDIVIEVSMIFLYTKLSLTQGNQRPEASSQGYAVRKVESQSGRVNTSLLNSNMRERLTRTYLFCTAGSWQNIPLVKAFRDCRGNWHPLILVEDGDKTVARLVRFAQPELQKVEDGNQVYRCTVEFLTEVFIAPGKTI